MTSDLVLEAMDRKDVAALVLLDLSKAFDSIQHKSILKKLRAIGISREATEWFRSYLIEGSHSVRIGYETSDPRPILHGVPQGSILGPALTPSKSAKNLGLVMDCSLTYDEHIIQVASKCIGNLCQIIRVEHLFHSHTLVTIISSLVISKLNYCSSVWTNTAKKNLGTFHRHEEI